MLTIVPNEDGEMVAVPVHVEGEDDDKMEVNMDNADNVDSQVNNLSAIFIKQLWWTFLLNFHKFLGWAGSSGIATD